VPANFSVEPVATTRRRIASSADSPSEDDVPGEIFITRPKNSSCKHCREVFFCVANCHKVEFLVEKIEHSGREKSRERRSDANVVNTQVKKCEQYGYSLLLIPRENEREWQIIDPAFEGFS
jgi:hypothetical protein